ncbi:hypothetical protein R9J42_07450 [Escherichia coli]|jgi:hypothetical protein|nr:hypothetical protein [Escherichia coli]MCV1612800.1 hypothetical protein [Escherichia coli]
MRHFCFFLLILSANTYADMYCDLIWRISKFQAQSFKKVSELEYDLVINTAPNMSLQSRVVKNMYPWSYSPVDGVYTYWVWFNNGLYHLPNGISFEVLSVNNLNTPNSERAIGAGNHTWTNGCTDLVIGGNLNWGASTNMTIRLKVNEPIPPGTYDFSGFTLPLKILYEENKGGYTDNISVMKAEIRRSLYISVDNWHLDIKAPTCSHNQLSLDFGQMTYEQAKAGKNISKNLSLSCKDNPVSVKLYFKDTRKTFTEAFCGKSSTEKNCKITIGENNKDNISFNKDSFSSSGSGTLNIPINAAFKSKKPEPGPFKDSVIIVAEIN